MRCSDGVPLISFEVLTISLKKRATTVKTADKGWRRKLQVLPAIAIACVVLGGAGRQNQIAQKADEQYPSLIRSVEGPDLYRAYCASCHGLDGKGGGPAASAFKAKTPDLTLLTRNNRGKFPKDRVRQMIMGDQMVAAHGSREMPIWGPTFHQIEEDVDRGNVRVENLLKYLESIQTTTPSKTPSGAELYKKHCAVCHGNDLKGTGPAPYPFKETTPDLTTLAERHAGKFPDAYVADVLRNGVVLPDHGPAEMPIWGMDFKARDRMDETQVTLRITNLSNYLKSLQAK
jgi:mono/diheme cytochrome c family protein